MFGCLLVNDNPFMFLVFACLAAPIWVRLPRLTDCLPAALKFEQVLFHSTCSVPKSCFWVQMAVARATAHSALFTFILKKIFSHTTGLQAAILVWKVSSRKGCSWLLIKWYYTHAKDPGFFQVFILGKWLRFGWEILGNAKISNLNIQPLLYTDLHELPIYGIGITVKVEYVR